MARARRRRRAVASALFALPAVGAIVACSGLLGVEADRYLATQDGSARDGGDASDGAVTKQGAWTCLANPAPQLTTATVDLRVVLSDALKPTVTGASTDAGSSLDVLKYTALPGVRVRACASLLDPKCETTGTPWQTTDDGGVVSFKVPDDFAGFIQATRSDLLRYSFVPGNLPAGVSSATDPFSLVSLAGAAALVSVLAVDAAPSFRPDSGAGLVFFTVYDCEDDSAPGISVSISNPDAVAFYATSGFISLTATETQQVGAGGFFNVPVGSVTLTATMGKCPSGTDCSGRPEAGTPIGSVTLPVNSASATEVWFRVRTQH